MVDMKTQSLLTGSGEMPQMGARSEETGPPTLWAALPLLWVFLQHPVSEPSQTRPKPASQESSTGGLTKKPEPWDVSNSWSGGVPLPWAPYTPAATKLGSPGRPRDVPWEAPIEVSRPLSAD